MKSNLYGLCIPVEGFLRTIIYDLQMDSFHYMPNGFERLLNSDHEEFITSQLYNTLINERLIYNENKYETINFSSKLSPTEFDYPSVITNAIVELHQTSDYETIIDKLCLHNCYNIQLVFNTVIENGDNYFLSLLNYLHKTIIKYCEIVIHYDNYIDLLGVLLNRAVNEVAFVFVFNAPSKKIRKANRKCKSNFYFSTESHNYQSRSIRNIKEFIVNTSMFVESKYFNNYYNRKLFIDSNGKIKNGPLSTKYFGNIFNKSIDFSDLSKDDVYKELGSIKKDDIDVCRNCEFRYMCIDNRIPLKHSKNKFWYHETECNYNPFIAKWKGDEGYINLKDSGIEIRKERMTISLDILGSRLFKLYKINSNEIPEKHGRK